MSNPINCPRCASHRVQRVGLRGWNCVACGKRWSVKPNYEDVIASFGGRFTGQSQDTGHRTNSGSEDDGIL